MDSLPRSLAEHTLRAQVDRLPILSTDHLATEPEWRRACVILGFLTHAYIWGGDSAAEVCQTTTYPINRVRRRLPVTKLNFPDFLLLRQILPPQLTVPFLAVSSHLGIPPIATYASLNLWNFRTTAAAGGPDLTDPDALQALHTFTGTPDESWFYIVSVAMEAQGAALIPTMLHALEAATSSSSSSSASSSSSVSPDPSPRSDHTAVTDALTTLVRGIAALGKLLERMDERCDPQVFYHRIRPFLAGSRNMAGAGLPRGVFYDEGEGGDGRGRGQWRMLRGGSNGQSSLVQFLDLVLGVEHATAAAGRGGEGGVSFHEEVRGYMPEPHRRFLQVVAERYPGGMKTAVARLLEVGEADDGGLSPAQVALREAFQEATRALAEFRNRHLQIVARYIIIPSRQPNANHGVNLATASSRLASAPQVEGWKGPLGGADAELTGTGGTALLPFLKQSRDETVQAGQLQVQ
jgi:indoleamine 2,3-dioxygenase